MRLAVPVVVIAVTLACGACADNWIVNTGQPPPQAATTTSTTSTGRVDPNLVDAHAYYVTSDDVAGYYFTTPSGKWSCAIIPRSQAGCQSAGGGQTIAVAGAPPTVQSPDGDGVAPNAVAIPDTGTAGFIRVDLPVFLPPVCKPLVLGFAKTLAAAGFRCNVQDTGVSCENESTRDGFTFSSDNYVPQYTPVPA